MWLPTVLVHLYVVPLLIWLHAQSRIEPLAKAAFIAALVCLLVSRLIPPLVLVAAPVTVVAVAVVLWQHRTARPLAAPLRLLCLAAIGVAGAATILFAWQFVIALLPVPDDLRQRSLAFAVVLIAVALAATLWRIAGERGNARWWFPVFPAALIPLALLGWDARTPWTGMVEAQGKGLTGILPERGSVYWEGGVDMLWFGLLRPSYFSCAQGAGAIFFRDAAIEFRRRAASFAPLHTRDFDEPDCRGLAVEDHGGRTREALQRICRQEPGLDFLVLTGAAAGVEAGIWISPVPLRSVQGSGGKAVVDETNRFYVYTCAEMR